MAPVLAAVERPEYSEAIAPTSALAVGVTVIAGLVPPPAVTGAVQMLCSVLSEALKCRTSVYVFPAESVTLLTVAALEFQVPTTTTMRLPAVIAEVGVSFSAVVPPEWAETCCTNAGGAPSADAPAEVRAQAKTQAGGHRRQHGDGELAAHRCPRSPRPRSAPRRRAKSVVCPTTWRERRTARSWP